jgi:hypothetical protein
LRATLWALAEAKEPGEVIELPFEWPQRPARVHSEPAEPPPIAKLLTRRPWLLPKLLALLYLVLRYGNRYRRAFAAYFALDYLYKLCGTSAPASGALLDQGGQTLYGAAQISSGVR